MRWIVAGGAVAGPSHRRDGRPCEDDFRVEVDRCAPVAGSPATPDDFLIAVVADGAGSAARAAHGARCAVTAACAAVWRWRADHAQVPVAEIEEGTPHAWLTEARQAVEALAASDRLPLSELSATCLLLVADASGVLAIQVGDGGIALRAADGGWSPLTWPLRGEYGNETVFLTSGDWREAAQVVRGGPCAAVALFSDGFEVLALNYRERRVNASLLDPLADFLRGTAPAGASRDQLDAAMAGYLADPAFDEHAFDDRTLVLACLVPEPAAGPAAAAPAAPAESPGGP